MSAYVASRKKKGTLKRTGNTLYCGDIRQKGHIRRIQLQQWNLRSLLKWQVTLLFYYFFPVDSCTFYFAEALLTTAVTFMNSTPRVPRISRNTIPYFIPRRRSYWYFCWLCDNSNELLYNPSSTGIKIKRDRKYFQVPFFSKQRWV